MAAIGFIGTGHIAAPMARALARAGHSVTVSERNADVADALVGAGLGIAKAANQQVVDASDTVFLCLRPAVWNSVVTPLSFRSQQQIVSVMAGVALDDIAATCAPVTRISATIPYGYIENGGCPLPVGGEPSAVQALFGDRNPVLPQRSEAALNVHFAASTMTSAALGQLIAATEWLADQTGDADAAEVYVANLVSGFLASLPKDAAGGLARERAALATPDTLNLQMVEGLRDAGAFDSLGPVLSAILASMDPPENA
ncbi:NAD(P)-binding domain-containing protein [Thalassococcus sp. BH17M4-6]|uniref:NAD(P)-binding domain-containing protein n=1 Tax=Thalassococcus sp. BH17M4-6 TaxID=3413148 RepID=UPI003BD06E9D